jgi:hypothetical protein
LRAIELRQSQLLTMREERECAWISHAGPTPTNGAMNGLKGDLLETHIVRNAESASSPPSLSPRVSEFWPYMREREKGAIHLLALSHRLPVETHAPVSSNLLLSHYNRQLIL